MFSFDISQLSESNPWWIDKKNILDDFKLRSLENSKYIWEPHLKHYISLEKDAILSIRGPRQVGKTTLVKMIIKDYLLERGIKPENIFFWSLENNDATELYQIVKTYLDWRSNAPDERKYLFLDEICGVDNWSKTIIHFANKGSFVNCSLLLTGSHSMDMKYSTELMPGRRGGDDTPLDKILLPMKFSEYVELLWPESKGILQELDLINNRSKQDRMLELFKGRIDPVIEKLSFHKKRLDSILEEYLITGGIPATITEFRENDRISTNLFNVYLNAIIGDLRRYSFKELFFKQIIREVFRTLSTPVSWNSFTKNTDVRSHNTVQDYVAAMEELFVVTISYRLTIHDGKIHPSMRKIYISDPFIFHALHGWANAKSDYFANAKSNILNLEMKSKLIECVISNHLCRFAYNLNPRDLFDPKDNLFYYRDKKQKEIDFVVSFDGDHYPFEAKYQASISPRDFFTFRPFGKGVLITKNDLGTYRNYVKIPVSLLLLLI